MEKKLRVFASSLMVFAFLSPFIVFTGPGSADALNEGGEKTLSPYFFVKMEEEGVELLPLKSTSAEVSIAGIIADVKVTQIYENKGNKHSGDIDKNRN